MLYLITQNQDQEFNHQFGKDIAAWRKTLESWIYQSILDFMLFLLGFKVCHATSKTSEYWTILVII